MNKVRLPQILGDAHQSILKSSKLSRSLSENRHRSISIDKVQNASIFSSPRTGKANLLRVQPCPVCKEPMGDMPGSRDAYCHNCGFKDPCCE